MGANKLKDNQLCAAINVHIHTVPVPSQINALG